MTADGMPQGGRAGGDSSPALRRRGSWVRRTASLVVVGLGASLIGYPFVSDWLNQRAQDQVAARQYQVVTAASPPDLEAEKQAARSYNSRVRSGASHVIDPFDPDDVRPGNTEYERVLNVVGDGVMAQVVIPKIKVDLPIYHYTNEKTLLHGVGHVVNTSVPSGGTSTHTILAGHTGLQSARIFDRLPELAPGDWFVIRVLGEDHAYRVYGTSVVLPEQVHSLIIEDGRDLVTLVTCTPYGVNSHRLLVHAERTELPAEWTARGTVERSVVAPQSNDRGSLEMIGALWEAAPRLWLSTPLVPRAAAAGAALAVVLLVLALLVRRLRGRRYGSCVARDQVTGCTDQRCAR
ncbi:MAG: class C sortase [Actinomycetia bacterium]|nr:class C sortase [Actinomycetes bacterium]